MTQYQGGKMMSRQLTREDIKFSKCLSLYGKGDLCGIRS